MNNQPNKSFATNLFWNAVFVGILVAIAAGIYFSLQSMNYTWRWERIPQYVVYEYQEEVRAPFDATSYVQGDVITLVSDADANEKLVIDDFSEARVSHDYPVYSGDLVAIQSGWRAGPLLDGLYITLKISLISIVFAILIGVLAGLGRIASNPAIRNLSITYI